ncbi:LD-carboxypeptidase [Sphingomicrobium flavum]|uniref:LD-carboxypeptidase n=1 Tax=Sphingomicrobium flavum TaxID=1229164 RepID=UPI0021ADC7CD|nr:LD-carboxypeptidase [Sphingomicrobium flavum]
MATKMVIALVAPACPLDERAAQMVHARANAAGAELRVHPQCFSSAGHFAGPDEERLAALREVMADDSVDHVWFARGGYGSNRIAETAMRDLPEAAFAKSYMGYSDLGFLLAGLHKAGCKVAHGPMAQDVLREGGDAAVDRAFAWMVNRNEHALEPGLRPDMPAMAFNLTVLSSLLGTPLEPDMRGMDLMVEEVSEHHYRIDRTLFHVTGSAAIRGVARLRMGRFSDVTANDRPFGSEPEAIFEEWVTRAGLGSVERADIGHDAANKVVPFGRLR